MGTAINLKKIIFGITVSALVSTLIVGLRYQGSFEQIELLAYDFLVRLNAKSGFDPRITIVGIDDNTLRKLNSDKISDGTLQQVLATIEKYNPKVIAIDIIRDIPIGEGREILLDYLNNRYQSLETGVKPIIFPCALPSENKPNGIAPPPVIDPDTATGFVDLETDAQNIFGGELVRRTSISSIPVNTGSEAVSQTEFNAETSEYLCTAPFSFGFITALGYVQGQQIENLLPDASPNIEEFLNLAKITEGEIRFKSLALKPLKPKTGSYHNLDPSIYQHLIDYAYTEPGELISLEKVLENQVTPRQFKDKVVLIGYITKEDIHQTPFGFRPGVFVHGWIVSQLLRNVLDEHPQLWTWSELLESLWIIGWGVIGGGIAASIRPLGLFISGGGIAIAILGGSCCLLFTQQGWIPLIPAMVSCSFSGILLRTISPKFDTLLSKISEKNIVPNLSPTQKTEHFKTMIQGILENSPKAERETIKTVLESFVDGNSETEIEPLVNRITELTNDASTHRIQSLVTEIKTLIANTPEDETHNLETIVQYLTKANKQSNIIESEDSLIGKTIGDGDRYLLQELLGWGGMSKVYLALDKKLSNKKVAIKIMTSYSSTGNHQYLIKRFNREVESLCLLNHPNIIQINDFGLTPPEELFDGVPFYVMEYCVGQTLQKLLYEECQLTPDLAIKIILKICYGLKEAHSKGIIHRDLKPDNIFLISGASIGEVVKIIDFGIAKKLEAENSSSTVLTMFNTFLGTYRYASPEQCRGKDIDCRTDIYSLGVVFYEILSGYHPYNIQDDRNTTKADLIASHLTEIPSPLREKPNCENISVELENIVVKCLEKVPGDRFQNIAELERALRDLKI